MLFDRKRDPRRDIVHVVTLKVPVDDPSERGPVADFNTILGRNAKV